MLQLLDLLAASRLAFGKDVGLYHDVEILGFLFYPPAGRSLAMQRFKLTREESSS